MLTHRQCFHCRGTPLPPDEGLKCVRRQLKQLPRDRRQLSNSKLLTVASELRATIYSKWPDYSEKKPNSWFRSRWRKVSWQRIHGLA